MLFRLCLMDAFAEFACFCGVCLKVLLDKNMCNKDDLLDVKHLNFYMIVNAEKCSKH